MFYNLIIEHWIFFYYIFYRKGAVDGNLDDFTWPISTTVI